MSKLREAKFTYFSQLKPQNCKDFWKTVKYINKKELSIPTLNDDSSAVGAHTSSEKADMLNRFFAKCFNHALPPLSLECLPHAEINDSDLQMDLLCTAEEVCSYLLALDANKAS